jgi:hypothetical protein
VEERLLELTSAVTTDLDWAAVPRERVALLLADPQLAFCRQYPQVMHDQRLHLLTEAEELALAGKSITGEQAWSRLLDELVADLDIVMDAARDAGLLPPVRVIHPLGPEPPPFRDHTSTSRRYEVNTMKITLRTRK